MEHGIYDVETPKDTPLCGQYKKSFAYFTIRYRLPNILMSLLDSMRADLKANSSMYQESDISLVLESIENLKSQVENNHKLQKISSKAPDVDLWNNFITNLPENAGFFNVCWLYAECYLYRKIYSIFEAGNSLAQYDYFGPQKMKALQMSEGVMEELIQTTSDCENTCETFCHILKLNLWGNKCDLSLSSGKDVKPLENLSQLVLSLNKNILVDDSPTIWQCLNQSTAAAAEEEDKKYVDFICDNAGFELFTDLLFGQYLLRSGLATVVRFHVKAMPWFVSDTTRQDIHKTLNYLQEHKSQILKDFGVQCAQCFAEGYFQIADTEYFWTTPYEFYRMIDINAKFYKQLSSSSLLIFKGDLNYRKLLGDFNWNFSEEFRKCLRGFHPTNLCTLRTIKGDLLCGLKSDSVKCPDLAEQLRFRKHDWMFTGNYAVVQFLAGNDGTI
ncbi:damage-control phosphatase ARMT1-like [Musca vetustissima]|uniref:damage-control phosphatase ARMT1-like n=1 Tax=Musca vetustissima TaxID=27455 RepID=UPI002AB6C827|nr:damage-control phosphatase ARMT1-like [Musca vetustissima]